MQNSSKRNNVKYLYRSSRELFECSILLLNTRLVVGSFTQIADSNLHKVELLVWMYTSFNYYPAWAARGWDHGWDMSQACHTQFIFRQCKSGCVTYQLAEWHECNEMQYSTAQHQSKYQKYGHSRSAFSSGLSTTCSAWLQPVRVVWC